jgi:RimJ/RimL family protein N-acetyltransferase
VSIAELVRTGRVILRPWRPTDAAALGRILDVSHAHLGPWIPSRVSTPAPLHELEDRLRGFADDFAEANEWRYAMLTSDETTLLGEISVFPRSMRSRVPYCDADRVEIGYWIRKDMTGAGLVSEAVAAVIKTVSGDPRFTCIEIRCDERNAPSGAVPARLGFTLAQTVADGDGMLQIWSLENPVSKGS